MSLELQTYPALMSFFGLHQGHLGHLPTESQLRNIQKVAKTFAYQLVVLEINSLLQACNQKDIEFELSVPMLGFTDPVYDFEAVPHFAIPLVVNNWISGRPSSKATFKIAATDISGYQYPLQFDSAGRVDYTLITEIEEKPIFTTLQSLQYRMPMQQILTGKGLAMLSGDVYQNKLLMLLPKTYSPFLITCRLTQKQKAIQQKEYIVIPPPISEETVKAKALWQGSQEQGELQISYAFHADVKQCRGIQGKLTLALPEANQAEMALLGQEQWWQNGAKKTQMTQYFGLSVEALYQILEQLIPYQNFVSKLSSSTFVMPFRGMPCNDYDKNPKVTERLYQYLLSGVINQTVPLYALKSFTTPDEEDFTRIKEIDQSRWSTADQMVFSRVMDGIANTLPDIEIIWDTLDSYLSFGPGLTDGKLVLQTRGQALEQVFDLHADFKFFSRFNEFPVAQQKGFDLTSHAQQYLRAKPDPKTQDKPSLGRGD